jgi:hypothetical protein
MVFGVMLPTLALAGAGYFGFMPACGLFLRHPIETLVQFGLAICIPLGNYVAWKRITTRNYRNSTRVGIFNGLSIGGAALVTAACAAVQMVSDPAALDKYSPSGHMLDFQITGLIAFLSFLVSLYLAFELKGTWETQSARIRQSLYSVLGIVISVFALAGSEVRPTIIRMAEQAEVSGTNQDKKDSLSLLRKLDCEKDLNMDVADIRTGGLSAMLLSIPPEERRQIYFAATGKPYNDNKGGVETISNLPDSYLGYHVVGNSIPGLSLVRSELSGTVNGQSLTSSLDWTCVFKNITANLQEARAELALPPGAVVSNLTLWENGEPKDSSIGITEQATNAYTWVVKGRRDPAMVTDLGRGRVLVQCYPVPSHGELKLRISMKAPLKLHSGVKSTLNLPRFIGTNFKVAGQHDLRLRSDETLSMSVTHSHAVTTAAGDQLFIGSLKDEDMTSNSISVGVSRANTFIAVAAPDFKSGGYVVESIKHTMVRPPSHLVVCVDGSESMKDHLSDIKTALKSLPKTIPTSVIIASSETGRDLEPTSLDIALAKLRRENFSGGNDNLLAVIKAASAAGDTPKGAVLWIHGPQPVLNREIFITSKFVSAPEFYELAIDDSVTKTSEIFKNHHDIGPFTPVSRNSSVSEDLSHFIAQWRPDSRDYYLHYSHMNNKPNCEVITALATAQDLAALYAGQNARQLVQQHQPYQAAQIAAQYHVVTPVTAAIVLEKATDYERYNLREEHHNDNDNQLANNGGTNGNGDGGLSSGSSNISMGTSGAQGLTNGTLGRLSQDATFVTGINTAGTVRVNNLANLEAMINLFANGFEILGIALGAVLFANAICGAKPMAFLGLTLGHKRSTRFALAALIALIGLAVPGLVNGLVASARDANLFS